MFIQTETTPNPNSLKFLLEHNILESGSIEFSQKSDCSDSSLASSLLQIDGIEKVFFGKGHFLRKGHFLKHETCQYFQQKVVRDKPESIGNGLTSSGPVYLYRPYPG